VTLDQKIQATAEAAGRPIGPGVARRIRVAVIAQVVEFLDGYGPLDAEWSKFFALVIDDEFGEGK
jgi:hypothetical protein